MSIRRTRDEYIKSVTTFAKPKKKVVKEKSAPVFKKDWEYDIPSLGVSGTVSALTRSEARAAIKEVHNIKGRVPLGTKIVQL